MTNEVLRQAPKAALQILQIFSFFHNEDIMKEIFKFATKNFKTQSNVAYEAIDEFSLALFYLCSNKS